MTDGNGSTGTPRPTGDESIRIIMDVNRPSDDEIEAILTIKGKDAAAQNDYRVALMAYKYLEQALMSFGLTADDLANFHL